ncbi:hypothetical protein FOZ63_002120, partial [Perkinsus olseni]
EEEKEERLKAIRVAIDETKGEVQRQHNKLSKWSVNKGKEESTTAAATQPSWQRRSPARSTSSETSSVPVVSDKIKSLSASIKELLGSNKTTTTTVEPGEKEETSSRRGVKREAEAAKKRPAKKPRQTKAKADAAGPVVAPFPPDTHGAEEPQSAAAEAPAKIPVPVGSPSSSSGVSSVVASSPVSSGSALDDLYSALSREMGVE